MNAVSVIDVVILWVHLFSAVLFVGGSFFMWMVVMPASHLITNDESERTRIVGKIAKQFGRIANPTLVVLVLTGVYNASWYLPSVNALFDTYTGNLLLTKTILVVILLVLIYTHNVYFGRNIVRLASEKKLDELRALRRRSRVVSFANLSIMVAILLLVTMMQVPP
ncbi:MAG: CopD family protein [Thaumarchaeota archaeon]|nr:CopD family protein [Nitrososphaerota archaeon]